MKKLFVFFVALVFVVGFGPWEKAGAVPVEITWTGPNTFSDETQTFAGFQADSVLSITGAGIIHSHDGSPTAAFVEVILGGILTPIMTVSSPTGASISLSSSLPLDFPEGLVTGIRFSAAGTGEFHGFNPIEGAPEAITFNRTEGPTPPPDGVPEPATLLFLGSGLLGLIAFRARFK